MFCLAALAPGPYPVRRRVWSGIGGGERQVRVTEKVIVLRSCMVFRSQLSSWEGWSQFHGDSQPDSVLEMFCAELNL